MYTSHASARVGKHAGPDPVQQEAHSGFWLPHQHTKWIANAAVTDVAVASRRKPLLGAAHSSQESVNLAESREMMQALRLCVGAMQPRTAQAFLMHAWNGNLIAEISDQLQLSAGNVRQMLSRARKVFRDYMAHDWTDCKGRRALREKASTS